MTGKPSLGCEGDGFWMMVRPSSGFERVKIEDVGDFKEMVASLM